MQAPAPRPGLRMPALRLPQLPPRDLECLASAPHSAPVVGANPSPTFTIPAPLSAHTKLERSPADVQDITAYGHGHGAMMIRGTVVSPGSGGGSGLVLPNLIPAQALPSVNVPMSLPARLTRAVRGPRTAPTSPTAGQMSQNEIKKAQNRKSAKRFREAQKQRWKNMADDLMMHKRTIDELRAQLAAQSTTLQQANDSIRRFQRDKRNSMSINDLVEPTNEIPTLPQQPPNIQAHAEAEAALYAQILSNISQHKPDHHLVNAHQPYVTELGLLNICVIVVASTARVVAVRRGTASSFGSFMVEGLTPDGESEFRTALRCGNPVALQYSRRGISINAVMNPIENSDRVVVAEFSPFH